MAIMSVVMAVFTGGVLQMFGSSNTSESISIAQSQIAQAFQRLDKEIRYAAGISTPCQPSGTACPVGIDAGGKKWACSGAACVEYVTTVSGTLTCNQLRLDPLTSQLQHRFRAQGSSATPSTWLPLASSVTSSQPFTFVAADDTLNFQRLQIRLTAASGKGRDLSSSETNVTFTALNTTLTTVSGNACVELRSIP